MKETSEMVIEIISKHFSDEEESLDSVESCISEQHSLMIQDQTETELSDEEEQTNKLSGQLTDDDSNIRFEEIFIYEKDCISNDSDDVIEENNRQYNLNEGENMANSSKVVTFSKKKDNEKMKRKRRSKASCKRRRYSTNVEYTGTYVKELQTPKGTLYYVDDGYFFCKTSIQNDVCYYRCHIKQCIVRAKYYMKERVFIVNTLLHSHSPDYKRLQLEKVKANMIRRCETEITATRDIYVEEISKCSGLESLIPYHSFVRTMQRKRKLVSTAPCKPFFRYASVKEIDSECSDYSDSDYCNYDETYEKLKDHNENVYEVVECVFPIYNLENNGTVNSQENQLIQKFESIDAEGTNFVNMTCGGKYESLMEEVIVSDSESTTMSNDIRRRKCVICHHKTAIFTCIPCSHLCLCKKCRRCFNCSSCPVCGAVYKNLWRVQLLFTAKGVLYHENNGYYYTKSLVRGSKMYLHCHVSGCPVRARTMTTLEDGIIESPISQHNHKKEINKTNLEIFKPNFYNTLRN